MFLIGNLNIREKASHLMRSSSSLMSSAVIGAQYGSTKAQNLLGVSFLGSAGLFEAEAAGVGEGESCRGRICSFWRGSKLGAEPWKRKKPNWNLET